MDSKSELCFLTSDLKNQIWQVLIDRKKLKPVKPIYILSYGPPASGKSSLIEQFIPMIRPGMEFNQFVEISIDKIVESIPKYSLHVNELKGKYDKKELSFKEFTSMSTSLYFQYRKDADELSSLYLMNSLHNKYNIVVETTGRTKQWSLKLIKDAIHHGYDVYIVYPYVSIENLISRSKHRAEQHGRLPDPKLIVEIAQAAAENLPYLLPFVEGAYVVNNDDKDKKPSDFLFKYTSQDNTICFPNLEKALKNVGSSISAYNCPVKK